MGDCLEHTIEKLLLFSFLSLDYDNDATREGYDRIIRCLGFTFDDSIFHSDMKVRHCKGPKKKYPYIRYTYEAIDISGMYFVGNILIGVAFLRSYYR